MPRLDLERPREERRRDVRPPRPRLGPRRRRGASPTASSLRPRATLSRASSSRKPASSGNTPDAVRFTAAARSVNPASRWRFAATRKQRRAALGVAESSRAAARASRSRAGSVGSDSSAFAVAGDRLASRGRARARGRRRRRSRSGSWASREECHGFGAPRRGAGRKLPRGRSVVRGRAWYDRRACPRRSSSSPARRAPTCTRRARSRSCARLRPGVRAFGVGGPRLRAAGLEALAPGRGHLGDGARRGAAAHPAHPRDPARARRARPPSGARARRSSSTCPTSTCASPRSSRSSGSRSSTTCRRRSGRGGRGRARKIAKVVDRMLCILPFEERFYEGTGVSARFVGHPLAERPPPGPPERYRAGARAPAGPHHRRARARAAARASSAGSSRRCSTRRSGSARSTPTCSSSCRWRRRSRARSSSPTSPAHRTLEVKLVDGQHRGGGGRERRGPREERDLDPRDGPDAPAHGGRLQAVLAHRTSVGRLLVRIAHFALVNILAGRGLVPELLQGEASPERMAAEMERLLGDRAARETAARGAARGARVPGRARGGAAGGRRGRARDGVSHGPGAARGDLPADVRRAREPRADRSPGSTRPSPDVDVLVVDDDSPDGTGRLADELAARDPRVKVLHRAGQAGARPRVPRGLRLGARARLRAHPRDGRRLLARSRATCRRSSRRRATPTSCSGRATCRAAAR